MDDIRALTAMDIHCAVGMAIYTGRLDLAELATLQSGSENTPAHARTC
jgi:phosphoribosylformimino-5-aminoimidazole carboxamide ribotide isomerase/phosphoribosyl-ATP pyrophosphohydrolase/phosphoribosyl-AMP cyclohydrolase